MPDSKASELAEAYLEECMKDYDSSGGVIECVAKGVPAGVGEPVFDKLDACLSKAVMSIGSVKAFEIGAGASVATMRGFENNDSFVMKDGRITKATNHSGGILGGISDGSDIILRAYIKPTPSIFKEQNTVNKNGENITATIKGRHDPVIVPRAVVVVEAMTALTLVDLMMENATAKLENLKKIYESSI